MSESLKVTILGAGAWGTTLAVILARQGHRTMLCARREEQRRALDTARENSAYLPGISIPAEVAIECATPSAVARADLIVLAVPSLHARVFAAPLIKAIRPGATIISATKGLEDVTLLTMSRVIGELVPSSANLGVIAGPGFAAEIARERPAALIAASENMEVANRVQRIFAAKALRVYSSADVAGVEICGAAKNVIAIAAGAADELDLGSSARAALITRGLAEIMRLVVAAGGRRETAAGLAGLGDLVLTCTGDLSRNRRAGRALARGELLDPADTHRDGAPVAEGIANARTVRALAAKLGVEMPIVDAVYRALYEGRTAQAMVRELLDRQLKAEFQSF